MIDLSAQILISLVANLDYIHFPDIDKQSHFKITS